MGNRDLAKNPVEREYWTLDKLNYPFLKVENKSVLPKPNLQRDGKILQTGFWFIYITSDNFYLILIAFPRWTRKEPPSQGPTPEIGIFSSWCQFHFCTTTTFIYLNSECKGTMKMALNLFSNFIDLTFIDFPYTCYKNHPGSFTQHHSPCIAMLAYWLRCRLPLC